MHRRNPGKHRASQDFVRQRGSRNVAAGVRTRERLDWWRSGVFNALFAAGAFFLLCALVRRLRGPNPLVALPYLLKWNTVLLGSCSFCFRFTLSTTIILVPQALAIRGFEAEQIGPAIIWSAVPLIPLAFIAALLLLRKFDPRLLLAIGLACTALAAWLNSQYTSTWAAENFYRTSCSPASGRRLLSSDLSAASCCKRSSQGLWPNLSGFLLFRLSFTPSAYLAAPQAPSIWAIF